MHLKSPQSFRAACLKNTWRSVARIANSKIKSLSSGTCILSEKQSKDIALKIEQEKPST